MMSSSFYPYYYLPNIFDR